MKTTSPRIHETGNALILTIISVVLASAFAGALLTLVGIETESTRHRLRIGQASRIAESGLDDALTELGTGFDRHGDGLGALRGEVSGGSYTVTITPSYSADVAQYEITAVGAFEGVQRSVRTSVSTRAGAPRSVGFLALNEMKLSLGALIDSYDSNAGDWRSQSQKDPVTGRRYARANAHVASNGLLSVEGDARVYGSASPGPGQELIVDPTAYVAEAGPALSEAVEVPVQPYSPPEGKDERRLDFAGTDQGTLTTGQYRYNVFRLLGDSSLVIDGDVELYLDRGMRVKDSAVIVVTEGSSLLIHLAPGVEAFVAGRGLVNDSLSPPKLGIVHHGAGTITLRGGSDFYGRVTAPAADVVAMGRAHFFGSITANRLLLTEAVSFHFDEAIEAHQIAGGESRLVVDRWREAGAGIAEEPDEGR